MSALFATQAYPPAPWRLRGIAVQASRLIDISVARAFLPPNVHVLPVLPGKTIAMFYCAQYQHGSTLTYSELALAPALIRAGGRAGFWISHIYVDDPRSVAGGRDIWRLPKQIATFQWSADATRVTVTQDGLVLCRAALQNRRAGFPLPLIAPVVIAKPAGFSTFWLRGTCRLARSRGEISADYASPVAQLQFTGPQHIHAAQALSLTVAAPADH